MSVIYICNHENNVPSRLSPQWLCGNSCTWVDDVRLHIGSLMTTYITLLALLFEHSLVHWYQQCVTVHHVPKCMSCHKAIVVITGRAHCFHDYIYIYYAHLASVRFEHSVCRGSLMTTYITLLALLVEHSLVHWYRQCVTVHDVPKCMSCHKTIVVITGRAHCFHDYIYILRSSCFCEI